MLCVSFSLLSDKIPKHVTKLLCLEFFCFYFIDRSGQHRCLDKLIRLEVLEFHSGQAAMAAPNSSERKACWEARDQLWKCLDDNDDKAASCQKFQSQFEANCPAQWVKYFTKRRDFLKYKERMEAQGFTPAEGPKQPS